MVLRALLHVLLPAVILANLAAQSAAQTTTGTQEIEGELKIRSGDVLALAYVFDVYDTATTYTIETGDIIDLYLPYSPEVLTFDAYTVPPDGMVAFRGTDKPTPVFGRTAQEVVADLAKQYAPVFSDPKMNFNVKPMFAKNMTLLRLFQAEIVNREKGKERTQSFMQLPVPADHLLSLPLLDRVPVKGLSVAELGRDLTQRYRALGFKGLTVSVWYTELAARTVSVLGQVRTPGAVSVGEGARLWDAVAKAGGPLNLSGGATALIIDEESTPTRRTFSLQDYLSAGNPEKNPLLHGGELISVGGNP